MYRIASLKPVFLAIHTAQVYIIILTYWYIEFVCLRRVCCFVTAGSNTVLVILLLLLN